MKDQLAIFLALFLLHPPHSNSQSTPHEDGYRLVWSDEFNTDGTPDPTNCDYEQGFVRNNEQQWYQKENATCKDGLLIIETRKEQRPNPQYTEGSTGWRSKRPDITYTSACLITKGKHAWQYGRFELRGRIDISGGLWPASWTLGIHKPWPANGEIDIMEYYRGMITIRVLLSRS